VRNSPGASDTPGEVRRAIFSDSTLNFSYKKRPLKVGPYIY
jgi:hypothetical protein